MIRAGHHLPFRRIFALSLAGLVAGAFALQLATAQDYRDSGPQHYFREDSPVGYLVSPNLLNALDLDSYQVEAIRDISHGFHEEYGHDLRNGAHLSQRKREYLHEARQHARREIIVGVLIDHQRERFILMYQKQKGHRRHKPNLSGFPATKKATCWVS